MMQVTPAENVLVRKMGGEAVLLNMKTETYYMLNSTGIRMWEVLSAGTPFEEALAMLAAEYNVEPDVIRDDLNEFIQSLHAAKLIEISE